MNKFAARSIFLVWLLGSFGPVSMARDKTLDIDPVYQLQDEWCWVTSGQMIPQYFNEPNVNPAGVYQCGVIGLYFGPRTTCFYDCRTCDVSGGSTAAVKEMLAGYPPAAAAVLGRPRAQRIRLRESGALSFADLQDEIENDRPVLAGINPGGGFHLPLTAQHAVVIVGYDDSDHSIVVNDPFPYEAFSVGPYQVLGGQQLERGQYSIKYNTFRDRLGWSASLYHIVDPNSSEE